MKIQKEIYGRKINEAHTADRQKKQFSTCISNE